MVSTSGLTTLTAMTGDRNGSRAVRPRAMAQFPADTTIRADISRPRSSSRLATDSTTSSAAETGRIHHAAALRTQTPLMMVTTTMPTATPNRSRSMNWATGAARSSGGSGAASGGEPWSSRMPVMASS